MGVLGVTGPNRSDESTVRSFSVNLPELLVAMALENRTLVCIAEFQDGRYIQFRVTLGSTITEVVSNQFLNDANFLSIEDQDHLRSIGFEEPSSSKSPNWRLEVTDSKSLAAVVNAANSAITFALHKSPSDLVRIRTFQAPE